MIVSFLNQKGGVGKTTLSLNVADALARRGNKVLLADSDPQHSAMTWGNIRSQYSLDMPFNIVGCDASSITTTLTRMSKQDGYDFVIVDGAPRMTDLARAAIMASDLIVMPMQPSGLDFWATDDLKKLIDEAKIFKPGIIIAVLLNRVVKNTNLAKDVLDELVQNDWAFFDTTIGQRQSFALAATQGKTVFEVKDSSAAQQEINSLTNEIFNLK